MSGELEALFGEFDFTNDLDRGANNLHEWLKHSPNVVALVNSIIPEIQEIHEAQKDVYSNINLFEAVGTQLDNIFGTLLDLPRTLHQADDDYRIALLSQSAVLSRSGELAVMKNTYTNLVAASLVSIYEYQPAAFKMEATVSTIPSEAVLASVRVTLERLKQAGNTLILSIADTTMIEMDAFDNPQIESPTGLSGPSFTGGTLTTGF